MFRRHQHCPYSLGYEGGAKYEPTPKSTSHKSIAEQKDDKVKTTNI